MAQQASAHACLQMRGGLQQYVHAQHDMLTRITCPAP